MTENRGKTVVELAIKATKAKTEEEKIGVIGAIIDEQHRLPKDASEGEAANILKKLMNSVIERFKIKGD